MRSALGLVALLAATPALAASPAWAAPTTQIVQGTVLRIVSVADWDAASHLLPGEPAVWDLTVSADAPDPGTVTVAVSAQGDAPLSLDVTRCPTAWQPSGCPAGATALREDGPLPLGGGEVALTAFPDTQTAHLRLRIRLTGEGGGSTGIRVHASGVGESAVIGSDGALAATGASAPTPWLPAAGVLAVAGGILLVARRARGARRAADAEDGRR